VHAAKRASFFIEGDIALSYAHLQAMRLEFPLAETPSKEPAFILNWFNIEGMSLLVRFQ